MNTTELVLSKLSEMSEEHKQNSPSGCACIFIQITDKIGAKFYAYRGKRDKCIENQKIAHKHGLGPEVFGSFEVSEELAPKRGRLRYKYCYLTEVAETGGALDDWLDANFVSFRETEKYMMDAMENIGLTFFDFHDENIGLINGELVCIDFGEE